MNAQPRISFLDTTALSRPVVGLKLQVLRKVQQLSQAELARRTDTAQTDISRAERAPAEVRFGVLKRLAEELGTSLPHLCLDTPLTLTAQQAGMLRTRDLTKFRGLGVIEVSAIESVGSPVGQEASSPS